MRSVQVFCTYTQCLLAASALNAVAD